MKTEEELERELIKLTNSFENALNEAQKYAAMGATFKEQFYYNRACLFNRHINMLQDILGKDEYL